MNHGVVQFEIIPEEAKAAVSYKGNSHLELFYGASSNASHFHPLMTTQHISVEGESPTNYRRNSDSVYTRLANVI